ncbi:ABC-2 transporter permease [uncultured Clostridium sp.]|uniref:ABC-2 transporter permease n=1 Tax=uncultured Clostridium sp. TaxID=59620 RepID=UPI0028E2ABA1|nr:ABC-2 transporter permease [uncultured Clostridium sp.]
MRAIYNLIKKDFLLVKKLILPISAFIVAAPIFISYRTPSFQEYGGILYSVLALTITFMIYHAISMEEMKQKGDIYLRITPMPMIKVILAKYILIITTFLVTTALYVMISYIPLTLVGNVDVKSIIITFTIIALFFGFYIPLTFKFGYVKLQVLSTGIIFISPFVAPLIMKHLGSDFLLLAYFASSPMLKITITALFIAFIAIISGSMLSNLIIKNKEY